MTYRYRALALAALFSFSDLATGMSLKAHLIQEYRAKIDVEAGLDKATRDLLQSLPEEVRKQAILALKEALPLIDESVEKYLDKVDDIVTKQLLALDCTIDGAVSRALSQAGAKLNPFKTYPTDLEDLRRTTDRYPSKAEWGDSVDLHVDRLGDLINASRSLACASKGNPITYPRAITIGSNLTEQATLFLRLENKTCGSPQTCVDSARAQVSARIADADKRDLQSTKAVERLAGLNVVKKPVPMVRKFDYIGYVGALRQAFSLETEVLTLTSLRNAIFEGEKAKALAFSAAVQAQMSQATAALNANQPDLDAKYNSLNAGFAAASAVTNERFNSIAAAVANAQDAIPERASELNEVVQTAAQLQPQVGPVGSALHAARQRTEKEMRETCSEFCFGSKNQFCPTFKRAKLKDCI